MSELYEKMMHEYPILFCQRNKSPQQTCMCWGIQADDGWYKPLNKLCEQLEYLNKQFYPKYKIRIQADQVKQKYGELRFYSSIQIDPNIFVRSFIKILKFIHIFIDKYIPFKYQDKIIKGEQRIIYEPISKQQYEKLKSENKEVKFENSTYYKKTILKSMDMIQKTVSNYKWLKKFGDYCYYNLCTHIIINLKHSQKKIKISNILNNITQQLIKQCEDECWNVCEWCGKDGGYKGENLTTTSSWISRICKECCDKHIQNQYKKSLQNKEQYIPTINSFKQCYDFLNAYKYDSFKYKNNYYHSIAEAFYCEKDKQHACLYQNISMHCDKYYVESMLNDAVKTFEIKFEDNDRELLKDIVKAKFSDKEYKSLLLKTIGYDLNNYVNNCDNVFGTCNCEKCKNKEKSVYVKILQETRKELNGELK